MRVLSISWWTELYCPLSFPTQQIIHKQNTNFVHTQTKTFLTQDLERHTSSMQSSTEMMSIDLLPENLGHLRFRGTHTNRSLAIWPDAVVTDSPPSREGWLPRSRSLSACSCFTKSVRAFNWASCLSGSDMLERDLECLSTMDEVLEYESWGAWERWVVRAP